MAQAKLFQKQRIQKTIFILSLLGAFSSSLFADGIPSWYTDEITVTEMEITRETSDGLYIQYINTIYSACTFIKLSQNIKSLKKAKNEAKKVASKKLVSALKENNIKEALKNKPELVHCSYEESLSNAGTYVSVQVVVSKEKNEEMLHNILLTKKEIEEFPVIGQISSYWSKSDKFFLADIIRLYSQKSIEMHNISFSSKPNIDKEYCLNSKSEQAFYYPKGRMIADTVYELKNTNLNFTPRNLVRGRKTHIIIRTDVNTLSDELVLSYQNNKFKAKITPDTNDRWRNLVFEIGEDVITEYTPEFSLEVSKDLISIGTIYIYQVL